MLMPFKIRFKSRIYDLEVVQLKCIFRDFSNTCHRLPVIFLTDYRRQQKSVVNKRSSNENILRSPRNSSIVVPGEPSLTYIINHHQFHVRPDLTKPSLFLYTGHYTKRPDSHLSPGSCRARRALCRDFSGIPAFAPCQGGQIDRRRNPIISQLPRDTQTYRKTEGKSIENTCVTKMEIVYCVKLKKATPNKHFNISTGWSISIFCPEI